MLGGLTEDAGWAGKAGFEVGLARFAKGDDWGEEIGGDRIDCFKSGLDGIADPAVVAAAL